ncbi:MAG TPA: multiheme c-type cytochrome [Candidatus Acidoferrum sp.]|nr:multiheme c-type cytochrome [Candidatus Acidoferrum sp.]
MKTALLIFHSAAGLLLSVSLLFFLASSSISRAQSPQSSSISLATEMRVRGPGWWPTKGTPARTEYTGPDACAECHELKSETAQSSAMLHAAVRAPDSTRLREHANLAFQVGPFTYQLLTAAEKSTLTVSNATSSLSVDLLWALGSGHMGQTFIYQQNSKFYESHVSFYNSTQSLDITPGQSHSVPATLEDAAGRAIPPNEARSCLGCHTTASTTNNQFDPKSAYLGVTCEACHGPGAQHIAAARAKTEKRGSGLTFNPAQLARVDSVDFCGACHRTWQDVVSGQMVGAGTFNVRFAPYRLENSRCWAEGDARITCMACHDPHKPLSHDVASYDANCLACHASTPAEKKSANHPGAACPVATKNCASCHMPEVEPPNLHSTFTDHWIRIAHPNSAYPE